MKAQGYVLWIIWVIVLALLPGPALAQTPGILDFSFGGDGKVTTDFSNSDDYGTALALQPDGKILVSGHSYGGSNLVLVRYNSNGSLDTTFSGDGKITTGFTGGGNFSKTALAIQPDSKILVAGSTGLNVTNDFVLIRYNPDGSLDNTFSGDGQLTTDFSNSFEFASALILQPDHKIIVAGSSDPSGPDLDFALVRYNSDGSLDHTFGGDGKVTTDFDDHSDSLNALALQPDGKLIAAGDTFSSDFFETFFALVRYNPDGSLDNTFDGDGRVITSYPFSSDSHANALALQPDGKILVGGYNFYNFILARYNPDGSLDSTFDADGQVITDFSQFNDDYGYAMVLQPDEKILLAGSSGNINGPSNFALARYHPDGSLDPTFGDHGRLTVDFGNGNDAARALALQPDGKILLAGTVEFTVAGQKRYDFGLTRHLVSLSGLAPTRAYLPLFLKQ